MKKFPNMKAKKFAQKNMENICTLHIFKRKAAEKYRKNHVANVKIMLKQKKTLKLLIEPFDDFLYTFSIVRSVFLRMCFQLFPRPPSGQLLS